MSQLLAESGPELAENLGCEEHNDSSSPTIPRASEQPTAAKDSERKLFMIYVNGEKKASE